MIYLRQTMTYCRNIYQELEAAWLLSVPCISHYTRPAPYPFPSSTLSLFPPLSLFGSFQTQFFITLTWNITPNLTLKNASIQMAAYLYWPVYLKPLSIIHKSDVISQIGSEDMDTQNRVQGRVLAKEWTSGFRGRFRFLDQRSDYLFLKDSAA